MSSALVRTLFTALAFGTIAFAQAAPATPITGEERLHWLAVENLAPTSLLENVAIGAENTLVNSPKEYGPHWKGFAERTGMITANYGVKSSMEAGLGAIWGEDPRYERATSTGFRARAGNVIKMTFAARNRSGKLMPAYARFLAIPGSNFLSNTWRPDSEATAGDAAVRTGLGFLSRLGENAWKEFVVHH